MVIHPKILARRWGCGCARARGSLASLLAEGRRWAELPRTRIRTAAAAGITHLEREPNCKDALSSWIQKRWEYVLCKNYSTFAVQPASLYLTAIVRTIDLNAKFASRLGLNHYHLKLFCNLKAVGTESIISHFCNTFQTSVDVCQLENNMIPISSWFF